MFYYVLGWQIYGYKYTIDYAKKQQKQVHICQLDKSQSIKLPQSPTDDQTNNQ